MSTEHIQIYIYIKVETTVIKHFYFFNKGLTILVENISRMRYMAHFRAVHRGAIFESMRTTEPRRLLPDAWGFICPVHTPDGTPCGLLNHLTKSCIVSNNHKIKIY